MKTPEEIKKGLECCGNDMLPCTDECPYIDSMRECRGCVEIMSKDALAYIRSLERERDWLVEELKQSDYCCTYCKHFLTENVVTCVECISTPEADRSFFEWRGVPEKEENNG